MKLFYFAIFALTFTLARGLKYSLFLEEEFEYLSYYSAYYNVKHSSHPSFHTNMVICLESKNIDKVRKFGTFKNNHLFVHALNPALKVQVVKVTRTLKGQRCNSSPIIYLI